MSHKNTKSASSSTFSGLRVQRIRLLFSVRIPVFSRTGGHERRLLVMLIHTVNSAIFIEIS